MNIVKGDLIKMVKAGKFDIFAHGCNCQHAMGAGIAKQIRAAFPEMYAVDGPALPGSISCTYITNTVRGKAVLGMNWYTQFQPGANFNLAYLQCVIEFMRHDIWDTAILSQLDTSKRLHVGVPLIGCGLGGGDVRQAMGALAALEAEERYYVTLVLLNPCAPVTPSEPKVLQEAEALNG